MPNSTAPESLHIALTPGVLSFTLQTPEPGNEISGRMMDAMLEALATRAADPQMRVLRLRAEGPAFCTGRERAGRTPVSIRAEVGRLIALKKALRASPLITVAEVQGDAHGFGMGLAMLCDFTLVSSSARLAFPEMRKGLPKVGKRVETPGGNGKVVELDVLRQRIRVWFDEGGSETYPANVVVKIEPPPQPGRRPSLPVVADGDEPDEPSETPG